MRVTVSGSTADLFIISSGVATGGLEPSLCGKCDVIFSYIYTNTTKRKTSSYLVRLH